VGREESGKEAKSALLTKAQNYQLWLNRETILEPNTKIQAIAMYRVWVSQGKE
jgi:hypothetical protein